MEGRVKYLREVRLALGTVNRVVEVGVLRGRYSAALLRELQPKQLILVDAWQPIGRDYTASKAADWQRRYESVVEKFRGDSRVFILRQLSDAAARGMADESLDMVYIDAEHTETAVFADLCAWGSKVRRGGFIAGHDFDSSDASGPSSHPHYVAVRRACAIYFGKAYDKLVVPEEPGHGKHVFPRSFFYQKG